MKTNRKVDSAQEQAVHKFLVKYLYEKMGGWESVDDKERQINGIDVVRNGKAFDEKTAITYPNKTLPTYALEVSYIDQSRNLREGWLILSNETDYYELNYVYTSDGERPNENNITKVESMFVEKKAILDFLESRGWTKEKLWSMQNSIRSSGKQGKILTDDSDIFFYITNWLSEQPINIVIKRYIYETLAKCIIVTTKEKYEKVDFLRTNL